MDRQSEEEAEAVKESNDTLDRITEEALGRKRGFTARAVRAVMRAREMALLAIIAALVKIRETGDPIQILDSMVKERDIRIMQLEELVELLHARIGRIDSRHRTRYTPAERFKVILYKQTYSLTIEETARMFLVSAQTIARWIDEAIKEPAKKTIGSLLKAVPPLMSYPDILRDTVRLMDRAGFGGSVRIAQTLAREGVKLSKETVRRWRKEPRTAAPLPESPKPKQRSVKAAYPNHLWMIDITDIPGLLRLFTFKLVVILDVFSRMPLAAQIFTKEPTGAEIANLVDRAAAKHSPPKHLVSDQGSQFKSSDLAGTLTSRGIKHRFGAIGMSGSVAIIERFWRTLKELGRLRLPFTLAISPPDLARRIETSLAYYAYNKPHQGLKGATPAEMYYAKPQTHIEAKRPGRAYERKNDSYLFRISYLDPDQTLPVLTSEQSA